MPARAHKPVASIGAPIGTKLTAKQWTTEAALRMLMNNLHPDVAERPEDLSSTAESVKPRGTGTAMKKLSRL